MELSRSRAQAPQLPGSDAAPLAGLGGSRSQALKASRRQSEWIAVAISMAVMIAGSVALYVVVQPLAVSARREHGGEAFGAVWAIGLGVGGLLASAVSWAFVRRSLRRTSTTLARSVLTEATVVTLASDGDGPSGSNFNTPVFRYAVPGRGDLEEKSAFLERGLSVGQPVAVRFDPEDPTWVVLDAHDYARDKRVLGIAYGAMVLVGLATIGFGVVVTVSL